MKPNCQISTIHLALLATLLAPALGCPPCPAGETNHRVTETGPNAQSMVELKYDETDRLCFTGFGSGWKPLASLTPADFYDLTGAQVRLVVDCGQLGTGPQSANQVFAAWMGPAWAPTGALLVPPTGVGVTSIAPGKGGLCVNGVAFNGGSASAANARITLEMYSERDVCLVPGSPTGPFGGLATPTTCALTPVP